MDLISPVVRYQGYMVKTTVEDITRKNEEMLLATDQRAALRPNGLLIHSDPTSFFFSGQYSIYHQNGVIGA